MPTSKSRMNDQGFTLLELIIVIIIVGILATLALPKLFSSIELSRVSEAYASIGTLRRAMDECYYSKGGDYFGCYLNHPPFGTTIRAEDPGNAPGAHFRYEASGFADNPVDPNGQLYVIIAYRNTIDGGSGDPSDAVAYIQTKSGSSLEGEPGGIYENIKMSTGTELFP